MKYFKIKNLTNTLKKRDVRANTSLSISYIDSMVKKNKEIFPGETLFLQLTTLPLSIHKLRINGLVVVSEISKDEFLLEQRKNTIKPVEVKKEKKETPQKTKSTTKPKPTGRKYTKKKDEEIENEEVKIDDDTEENKEE